MNMRLLSRLVVVLAAVLAAVSTERVQGAKLIWDGSCGTDDDKDKDFWKTDCTGPTGQVMTNWTPEQIPTFADDVEAGKQSGLTRISALLKVNTAKIESSLKLESGGLQILSRTPAQSAAELSTGFRG